MYRKVKVEGREGIFHGWFQVTYTRRIVSKEGTNEIPLQDVVAIVEFIDGHIEKCKTTQIEFIDAWPKTN